MKDLKIGVKIAVGFGAVLFLVFVMSLMVFIGNMSIRSAVTTSGLASDLQARGKDVLYSYAVMKDNVTTIELLSDDEAYAQAVEYLAKCKQDIVEMKAEAQTKEELYHFLPTLETLSESFDKWGESVDELQASNKRLDAVIEATYKSGSLLSTRSSIAFEMQMDGLLLDLGSDMSIVDKITQIGKVRSGQKIATDLTNIRRQLEVMISNFDTKGFEEAMSNLEKTLEPIRASMLSATTEEDKASARNLEIIVREYIDEVTLYGVEIEISRECIATEKGYSDQVLQNLNTLLNELDQESIAQTNHTLSASSSSLAAVITSAAIALLLGVLIAIFIVRSVTRPIDMMVKVADSIAVGDVDVKMEINSKDEIGVLGHAFKKMIDGIREQVHYMELLSEGDMSFKVAVRSEKDVMNLGFKRLCKNMSDIFVQLKETASLVATASNDIAQGSQHLASGTSQQASTVEELSASLADISKQTKENSQLAEKASELGIRIKSDAERGNVQMEQMVGAVAEITDASRSISGVMKIIDDIAFQTNILALNAAVEAARAGQHGKGFAVVADEVRSLASKSAEAAKNTGAMIENSIEKAELGAKIATETSDSLKKIVDGIMESTSIVGDIAESSVTQAQSVEQINHAIGLVTEVIQRNTATSEQSAASADKMKDQSQELSRLISEFKLAEKDDAVYGRNPSETSMRL